LKTEVGTSPARASTGDLTPAGRPGATRRGAGWGAGNRRSRYDGRVITLYDNAFSPFARKVRIALALKALTHEVVDGLAVENHARLAAVNGRVEVPALDHDGVVVVGSSDIIAYLERVWPRPALYPEGDAAWVHARAWERCADTLLDPILTNLSYWLWAVREDAIPEGLLEAGRRDLDAIYQAIERDLGAGGAGAMLSGSDIAIGDVALFPHLTATRALGVGYDAARFPRLHGWLTQLRAIGAFTEDLRRVRVFLAREMKSERYERRKIFWRGDRIEWMLARGHHGWLTGEIAAGRVLWPGPAIPAPRGNG
jgi:glutathione S-transferase